jgi:cell division protein FtsN
VGSDKKTAKAKGGPAAGKKQPTLATAVQSRFKSLTKAFAPKTASPTAASAKVPPPPPAATKPSDAPKDNGASATADSDAGAAPPMPPEYCLQIGAFTDLKLAKQLQATLKDRGYSATIFEGISSDYKTWHAVRVSKYPDIDSATKAAHDFTSKERLQAIVRPSSEL